MSRRKNLLITTIGRLDYYKSWLAPDRNYDIALMMNLNDKIGKTSDEERDYLDEQYGLERNIRQLSSVPKKGILASFLNKISLLH